MVTVEIDSERARMADEFQKLLSIPLMDAVLVGMVGIDFPGTNFDTLYEVIKTEGFEYTVSQAYARQADASLKLVDELSSGLRERDMAKLSEVKMGYLELSLDELGEQIEAIYNLSSLTQVEQTRASVVSPENSLAARDARTEKMLREVCGRRVVHIGGLLHIYGGEPFYVDGRNLYDRLADLNPTRIKLNEADLL